MRLLTLPSGQQAILSDTVGFVADLPTDLIAAFRATLEEVRTADLVLHVRDLAHPETAAQRADVLEVLGSLGLADLEDEGRLLEFWNKLDLLAVEDRAQLRSAAERQANAVCGSALTGEGIRQLLAALDQKFSGAVRVVALELDSADGARLAWLYRHGTVLERRDTDGRTHLKVALPPAEHRRLHRDLPRGSILEAERENPPRER
jgi:GTP-binding protein HflX